MRLTISVYLYIDIHIYIYTYIYREKERDRRIDIGRLRLDPRRTVAFMVLSGSVGGAHLNEVCIHIM